MHNHAVRVPGKDGIANHALAHGADGGAGVLEGGVPHIHILLAHSESAHFRQLSEHQHVPSLLVQLGQIHLDALHNLLLTQNRLRHLLQRQGIREKVEHHNRVHFANKYDHQGARTRSDY